jgi:hypothetical protein
MPVELAPELLEILACPNCHSALAVDEDREELVCVASDCGLAYPVVGGIPVMLVDEARRPGAPEDARRPGTPEDARRPGAAPGAMSEPADPAPAEPAPEATTDES